MASIPVSFRVRSSGILEAEGQGDVGRAVASFLNADLQGSLLATRHVLNAISSVRNGERSSWTNTYDENEAVIEAHRSRIGFLWAEQFEYVEVETSELAAAVQAWHDVIEQAEDAEA